MVEYEKMAKLLDSNNLTAYRVAKDTGLSTALFYEWKSGKSMPKQDKIQRIADYFGVPLSYFYDEDAPLEPSYYIDEEVAQIAQELHDDPNMRGLFKAARNLSKEDILRFKEIIEGYERGNTGNNETK